MVTLNFNADQVTLTSLMNTERPSDTLSRNMIFKILSDILYLLFQVMRKLARVYWLAKVTK